jgi:hypothetical protein
MYGKPIMTCFSSYCSGFYRVMYWSSCGLIRPLQGYKISPLFLHTFPSNVSGSLQSDLAYKGQHIILHAVR